jgi:N-acetylneuraminate synthase
VIQELKQRYQIPIGYSDHSADIGTCIAASALGAEILEFHAVFSREEFGPDAKSSIEIPEIPQLVKSVRQIALSRKHTIDKSINTQYTDLKRIFEKSLAVNKDLPEGHQLTFADLEAKKPKGYGIDASQFEDVIGSILNKPLKQWNFLNRTDIHE